MSATSVGFSQTATALTANLKEGDFFSLFVFVCFLLLLLKQIPKKKSFHRSIKGDGTCNVIL